MFNDLSWQQLSAFICKPVSWLFLFNYEKTHRWIHSSIHMSHANWLFRFIGERVVLNLVTELYNGANHFEPQLHQKVWSVPWWIQRVNNITNCWYILFLCICWMRFCGKYTHLTSLYAFSLFFPHCTLISYVNLR